MWALPLYLYDNLDSSILIDEEKLRTPLCDFTGLLKPLIIATLMKMRNAIGAKKKTITGIATTKPCDISKSFSIYVIIVKCGQGDRI